MPTKSNDLFTFCTTDGSESRTLSVQYVSQLTGYDPRTLRTWHETGIIPKPARQLLEWLLLGKLDVLHVSPWKRWRLAGDRLHNIETRESFTAPQLEQAYLTWQRLEAAQNRIDVLEACNQALTHTVVQLVKQRPCRPSWHQRQTCRASLAGSWQPSLFDQAESRQMFQAQKSPL
jgi:hypothetical protein